jgi:hypothetical protein
MIILNENTANIIKYLVKYLKYNDILLDLNIKILDTYFNLNEILKAGNSTLVAKINVFIGYINNFIVMINIFNQHKEKNKDRVINKLFFNEIYFNDDINIDNVIIKKIDIVNRIGKLLPYNLTCLKGCDLIESDKIKFIELLSINDDLIFANEPDIVYKIVDIDYDFIRLDKKKVKDSRNQLINYYNNVKTIIEIPKYYEQNDRLALYYNLTKLNDLRVTKNILENNKYIICNLITIYEERLRSEDLTFQNSNNFYDYDNDKRDD